MSNIKDLFSGKKSEKLLENATQRSVGSSVESPDYLRANVKDKHRVIPYVDFSSASNFAIYGSAEKYYEDAYNYILNEYPYDGSLREKIDWSLSGSYLDRYIFENNYPRTTGYINFGQSYNFSSQQSQGYDSATTNEWIYFKGNNVNSSLNAQINPELTLQFDNLNIYNTASQGLSNLELEGSGGISTEFWFKKESFDKDSESRRQVVLDIWNSGTFGTAGYGRFRVEISGTEGNVVNPNFHVELLSGSSGFSSTTTSGDVPTVVLSGSTLTGSWNHFALTFVNTGSQMTGRLYTNGALSYTYTGGTTIGTVTGSMIGQIGSLIAPVSGGSEEQGYGKLSASLDEFRFWKTRRNATQIGQHWFTQVGGGTNTDLTLALSASTKYSYENPADLGVYYKFNEGIINTSSINNKDAVVIDYAGRVTNGAWAGYSLASRNTGSAIVSASAASFEFADPILYSTHPLVSSSLNEKKNVGKLYDATNNSSMFDSLPNWITSNDGNTGKGALKNLTQIMSSYFDTLYLQTQAIPGLKNKDYISGSNKPFPFTNRFIDSSGFLTSEIFSKATDLEYLDARNNKKLFIQKINELKNLIYQNVYNNLVYVYKTKGTMKSFKNLIRCFGVDDELINIRLYGDEVTYKILNNYRTATIKKRYVNFYDPSNFDAVVFQQTASGNSYSRGYISSSAEVQYRGNTYELETFFPPDKEKGTSAYFNASFATASIFGCHTSGTAGATTWGSPDYGNFQVSSIRPDNRRNAAYFHLTSVGDAAVIPSLTSSVFQDVYDETRWNFAVRIKPKKYPLAAGVSGSDNGQYDVEFSGYNYVLDVLNNSFNVTASLAASDAQNFLKAEKRFFVGAHKTNTTGSTLQQSNVKASSLRVWLDYLTSSVLQAHAKDITNFGSANPYRDAYITESGSAQLGNKEVKSIPQLETLILNWDFETVTSSDAGGNFTVQDVSIASSGSNDYTGRWGWLGPIGQYQHTGYGYGFPASSTGSIDRRYVSTLLQEPPEVINSSDMISLIDKEQNSLFSKDSRPEQYFFAFEKSMYNIITKEILDIFATIVDFNNLIGEPVNRYRAEYKNMQKLRQLYFERVQNTIDLDKFVEYFKWLDSALSVMLQQLVPGSARFSENLRTMVESHVLERNKYHTRFPTLDNKTPEIEAGAGGAGGTADKWGKGGDVAVAAYDGLGDSYGGDGGGSAPLERSPQSTSASFAWWHFRADRSNSNITSGDSTIDSQRNTYRNQSWFKNDSTGKTLAVSRKSTTASSGKFATTTTYKGKTYEVNNSIKVARLRINESPIIHGGTNFPRAKTVEYTHTALKFGSNDRLDISASSIPAESERIKAARLVLPSFKYSLEAKVTNTGDPSGYTSGKSEIFAPFNLFSSSVTTGYVADVASGFRAKTEIDNYHDDIYGDDKGNPAQGPFTERHVGGRQHRHIDVNTSSATTTLTRPEAWNLSLDSNVLTISQRTVHQPRATMIRDAYAKRPLNIANLKWGTSSAVAGNYRFGYQIFQTSGRRLNNRFFVANSGFAPTASDTGIFSGAIDYALPRFDLTGTNQSIFVERFNAPGGPEVSSRGCMDVNAEEYSVYNELNNRNLIVRTALDSWLTEHCGQFGIDPTGSPGDGTTPADHRVNQLSYGGVIAAYYKVNRNPRIIPALTDGYEGAPTCSILYDNWYVQHPIPQSDFQYAWITASVSKSACDPLGHIGAHDWAGIVPFSVPSGITSITQSVIPFISASLTGTLGIDVDFVGLNTLIYEPFTSSTNILGYPLDTPLSAYRGQVALLPDNAGVQLNSLNLHRNGPYQYPSWKQIRADQHPIARHQRSNNVLSVMSPFNASKDAIEYLEYVGQKVVILTYLNTRRDSFKNFVEPPVTFKYRPLRSNLSNVDLQHSYGNNKCLWTQRGLPLNDPNAKSIAEFLNGVNYKTDAQIYDKLNNVSAYQATFKSLTYPEVIYPRGANTGLARTRARTQYAETASVNNAFPPTASLSLGSNGIDRGPLYRRTLWRDADYNRNRYGAPWTACTVGGEGDECSDIPFTGFTTTISNSLGNQDGHARSVWCFGKEPLVWQPASASTLDCELRLSGASSYADNVGQDTGELNSANILKLGGMAGTIISGTECAKLPFYNTPSASAYYYWLPHQGRSQYGWSGSGPMYPSVTGTYTTNLCKGLKWTAAVDSGKNPWFDSYAAYSEDIRGLSKAWTILPEFRISDQMAYYVESKGGNFRSKNDKFLLLNGANITQSADVEDADPNNPAIRNFDRNFFKEYSFSDFQKYFGTFSMDNKLDGITLKCNAVKKLLPYKGFYPADRTTQLVSLFSGALAQYITGGAYIGADEGYVPADPVVNINKAVEKQMSLQAALQPWFAPGILYNTIKSGIAVDWPGYTGSFELMYNNAYRNVTDSGASWRFQPSENAISGSPNARFDFTSLLNPLESMPISSSDCEGIGGCHEIMFLQPSYNGPIADWGGVATRYGMNTPRYPYAEIRNPRPANSVMDLYSSAMHNYLAEIPNFFLKNNGLQYVETVPQAQIEILKDKVYVMDVFIEKFDADPNNQLVMLEDYYNGYVSGTVIRNTWGTSPSGYPITASWNGKYFGPPFQVGENNMSASFPVDSAYGAGAWPGAVNADPAYAPVAPPYFYGKAHARLIYTGTLEDQGLVQAGEGPNFKKIFANMTMSFKSGDDRRRDAWLKYGKFADGTFNFTRAPAYAAMMDVTASLNILGIRVDQSDSTGRSDRWVIAPHMETPVLDFSSSQTPEPGYGRGMWSGYGEIPINNKGIYFGVERSPNVFLNRQDVEDMTHWFRSVSDPRRIHQQGGRMGRRKKVGEMAEKKSISEAIVAIPFYVGTPYRRKSEYASLTTKPIMGKRFFSLGTSKSAARQMYDLQKYGKATTGNAIPLTWPDITETGRDVPNPLATKLGLTKAIETTSISDLSSKLNNYVLPPELDFDKYSSGRIAIEPFVMYIMEFHHELSQQDLTDIWQGLMPQISTTAELDESIVKHPKAKWEFFGDKELPSSEDIRWMIFKVKKRADVNYWALTPSSEAGVGASKRTNPLGLDYSYNWPYDYFSLVELAQVQTEGKFIKKAEISTEATQEETEDYGDQGEYSEKDSQIGGKY